MRRWIFGPALAAGIIALGGPHAAQLMGAEPAGAPPGRLLAAGALGIAYVDEAGCAACHRAEHAAWAGSDHRHAMEPAGPASVRGDFEDAVFTAEGVEARFFRRDGGYWINAEGPDGRRADFKVEYTFGWDPLQQYLLALPGGRLQAFDIAWDVAGGRWLALQEAREPGDPLHWTGRDYNWNFRCASCHSTDLQPGYDLAADAYATTWASQTVGCQACHGPAGAHLAWVGGEGGAVPGTTAAGFAVDLAGADSAALAGACGRCHARRRPLTRRDVPGAPFLDHFMPELLEEGLYHADGQILDEVYEWGSFLQSPMHGAGVRCTDCHDPHAAATLVEGNGLCTQCHNQAPPERFPTIVPLAYDSPAHHFHGPGPGSRCVDCHMAEETYMVVDPRRDHGLRVPRPDLAEAAGAPDACTACHDDRTPEWAAARIADWYGPGRRLEPQFGVALALGRAGAPGGQEALAGLAAAGEPAIVRATAASLLGAPLWPVVDAARSAALKDPDPLVRIGGLRSLAALSPQERLWAGEGLLGDPVRAVRIQAAAVLAPVPASLMDPGAAAAFALAAAELEEAAMASAERPESHLALGNFHADRGDAAAAEAAYATALRLDPSFVPALLNLAELHRSLGRAAEEADALGRAAAAAPDDATVQHAVGLFEVRRRRYDAALAALGRAVALAPGDPRFAYVHAVALAELAGPAEALQAVDRALALSPNDPDLLAAAAALSAGAGDRPRALAAAERLVAIRPDEQALALLRGLRGGN